MSTMKPGKEVFFRVILILAILFNSLAPTPVHASVVSESSPESHPWVKTILLYLGHLIERVEKVVNFDQAANLIFADGFESGNLSAWDWIENDDNDLSVTSQAAYHGNYGLQVAIDDTTNVEVAHWLTTDQTHYSARFYLHPNSISIAEGDSIYVFAAIGNPYWTTALFLGWNGTNYTLTQVTYDNDVTWIGGNEVTLSNAWNAIEIEWKAATEPGAENGHLRLWVNGALADIISNVDNDTLVIASEYIGALSFIPTGVSGTLYFDDFESRSGIWEDGGTATPTPTQTKTTTPTVTESGISTNTPTGTATVTITPTITLTLPPITRTPTPTRTLAPVTSTTTPTTTATATITPTLGPVTLNLDAPNTYAVPAQTARISWHIGGVNPAQRPVTLKFYAPEGFTPVGNPGVFDITTSILTIAVSAPDGYVDWQVSNSLGGPYLMTASLLESGQTLGSASLTLDRKYEFTSNSSGGQYTTGDNEILVNLPAGAITGTGTLLVGDLQNALMPEIPLSENIFEIQLIDQATGQEIHTLAQPATIQVKYSDEIPTDAERDLALYYYNPTTELWERLASTVDPVANTLTAETTHFSVFDMKVEDWQASNLPTVANFQVSQFTGAATYSVGLVVPPGPVGLQPNLSVSYNSQTVDGGSSMTQASWVGMGWSLDTGHIERDTNGTPTNPDDDTYTVVYGGVSSLLLHDGTGKWHLADENFWRAEKSGETWFLWDKSGNKFTFGETDSSRASFAACQGGYPWRYALSRVTNIHGVSLTYEYVKEGKTITGCAGQMDTAIYPSVILYPHSRYRVSFVTTDRGDYDPSELTFFAKKKLSNVVMQWYSDSGSWQTIRTYHFSYYNDPGQDVSRVIFPNYVWKGPAGTTTLDKHSLTLRSIQEFGTSGGSLPATTFVYGDGMHLTHADNGYGATVDYAYSMWYGEFAPASTVKKQDFGANQEPCGANPSDGALGKWDLRTQDGTQSTNLYCQGGKLLAFKEITNTTLGTEPFKPGRLYKINVQARAGTNNKVTPAVTGSWLDLGFFDGSQGSYQFGSQPQYYGGGYYVNRISLTGTSQTYEVLRYLPATASKLNLLLNTNGAELDYYSVVSVPTYYRVSAKTIGTDDDNDPNTPDIKYTYSYQYEGAATNTEANSSGVTTSNPLNEKYSEFRGHRSVTETGPDEKRVVITWFYQGDTLKGREERSFITEALGENSYKVFTENSAAYSVLDITTGTANMPKKNGQVVTDLGIRWLKADSSASCAYNTLDSGIIYGYQGNNLDNKPCYYQDAPGANTVGTRSVNVYDTVANFGNLIRATLAYWNGAAWVNFRATETGYNPRDIPGGAYLVELPAWQKTLGCDSSGACNTLLGASYNYYDNSTDYNTGPTQGRLTRVRTLTINLNGTDQYSQVDFGNFDSWGNARTTTTYSGYVQLGSSGTPTGARAETVAFDSVYGAYTTSATNALGHITQMGYDYRMGVMTSMTDPNQVNYTAQYDQFGRIWKVFLPGDTQTSTEITYYDNERPFRVKVSQWITGSTYFNLSRSYDGIGRMVNMTTIGAKVEGVTANVKTDYSYDEYGRVKSQTVPYTTETNPPRIRHEYDVLGRLTRKIAPNGDEAETTYANVNTAADPLGGAGSVPGQQTTVTDAANRTLISLSDPLGRALSVNPPIGSGVTYTYDQMDRLKTALYAGKTTLLQYDYAGRKLQMNDPAMGLWVYEYDALGNMTRQTDARLCISSMVYDNLGRLETTTYSGPGKCATTPAISMVYDQGNDKGRMNSLSDSSGTRSWVYDERGRVKIERYSIDNTFTFEVKYEYAADRLEYVIYPDGEKVSFTYNPQKMLESISGETGGQVTTYVAATNYDASGRITARALGANLLTSVFSYKPWTAAAGASKPSSVTLTRSADNASLQNLSYTYYAGTGNIETITDHLAVSGTGSQVQTFTYDDLDRLTSAAAVGGTAADGAYSNELYEYDAVTGDLKQKGGLTLNYADPAHAHAVTSTSSGSAYTYDANGNQITRTIAGDGAYTLHYDATNRLVQVDKTPISGAASTVYYIYDGQGKLVVKKTATEETVYVGEYYERTFPLFDGQIQDNSPVPMGTILPFAAASCPADWALISGSDGSFNNLFPQGAPAGGVPGVVGGFDSHSHVYTDVPAHTHSAGTLGADAVGNHTHTVRGYASYNGAGNYPETGTGAIGTGTTTSESHNHFLTGTTTVAGASSPSTSSTLTLPPYLNMLFCRKSVVDFQGVPSGAVAIFDLAAGQQLPANWVHFTALDGRFPRGAAVYGGPGGSAMHTHTYSQVPAHSHEAGSLATDTKSHSHSFSFLNSITATGSLLLGTSYARTGSNSVSISGGGAHDHSISGQLGSAGTSGTFTTNSAAPSLPPYQEVPYAQKTAEDGLELPIGAVMLWQGSSCPATWQRYTLLDGRFPLGGAYVGASGGSPTHNHTYTGLPAHTHGLVSLDIVAIGDHQHEFNFASTSSNPATGRVFGTQNAGTLKNSLSSSGAHSHSITGNTASAGVTTPTTQSASSLPPYVTVVFCKKVAPSQTQGGGVSTVRKYYFTDEDRVAMRENGTLYFLANDHLGSTSMVINTSGVKVAEMRYKPWGETRYEMGSMPTDYLYTGQRNNAEIGLYYYGARWYDSALGRFAQADTNIPAHQGSQGWDRYAYVNNNPIQFTDSTGQWVETAFDILSLAMTINDIRNEGFTVMNTISLVTDVAAVVLPVVPAGVSQALRAAKYASKAVNAMDTAADSVKLANKVDDAVKAAKNLVKYGDEAKDAQKWIRNILDVSVHNADSSHAVLGSYNEYITYAQKAKTVKPGQGHTYYNMPDEVWDVLKSGDSWKSVNKQYVIDQVDQGKRFLGKLGVGKSPGDGLKFELDILSELGRKIRWLK